MCVTYLSHLVFVIETYCTTVTWSLLVVSSTQLTYLGSLHKASGQGTSAAVIKVMWKFLTWKGGRRRSSNFRISMTSSMTSNSRWRRNHSSQMEDVEEGVEDDQMTVVVRTAGSSSGTFNTRPPEAHNTVPQSCTEIHPLFSAIQLCDVEEVRQLLLEAPQATREVCAGLSPLHAATHLQHLPILRLLLQHNAHVEMVDGLGNTSLYTAVCEGWLKGVVELLKNGASPDTHCSVPPSAEGVRVGDTPMQMAVRLGNASITRIMMNYSPDVSLLDSDGCCLLHLAAHAHSTEILSLLLEHKVSSELLHSRNNNGDGVMHTAIVKECEASCENALLEVLQMLFDAGVDVNSTNNQGESPLFLAACFRFSKGVQLLLSMGADPLVVTQSGESVVHGACYKGCSTSLTHLLDTGRINKLITKPDNEGIEPFLYAVRSSSIDCCDLLLNNGDHLTRKDIDGTSRCSLLLKYLPSATDLLKQLFDNRIQVSNEPQQDPNFHVTFDYSVILSQQGGIQSSLIYDLNNTEAEPLLKHPLVESFLGIKWNRIRFFFYSKIVCFFIFLLLHTVYIVSVYKKESEKTLALGTFRYLHIFMYSVILWPELFTIIGNAKRYIKHWETLTKVIALGASAYVVFVGGTSPELETNFTNSTSGKMSVERQVAATSVFFGWVELMMLCGRLPILGSNVLMFTRIAKSAIKFIAAFIGLLIGFAASFMVLFYDKKEFSSFFTSLVKTFMMMIGELDYTELVDSQPTYLVYIFLTVFLFLVCILMANLLIGLAVDDISNLERLGEIERLSKQASYLITFEKLTSAVTMFWLFPHRLAKLLINISTINHEEKVYVNKKRSGRWQFRKYQIPKSTVQAAILIARSSEDSHKESAEQCVAEVNEYVTETKKLEDKLDKLENMMKEKLNELFITLQSKRTKT
nr:transient receptor potential channel pyrexia-like [Cherax quadricarinatus]